MGGAKLEINGELEVGREEESGELGVESLKFGNKTTPPPQNIFSHIYIHCCPYSHFLMSNLLPPIPCPLPTFHFHLGNRFVQREWDRDNRKTITATEYMFLEIKNIYLHALSFASRVGGLYHHDHYWEFPIEEPVGGS